MEIHFRLFPKLMSIICKFYVTSTYHCSGSHTKYTRCGSCSNVKKLPGTTTHVPVVACICVRTVLVKTNIVGTAGVHIPVNHCIEISGKWNVCYGYSYPVICWNYKRICSSNKILIFVIDVDRDSFAASRCICITIKLEADDFTTICCWEQVTKPCFITRIDRPTIFKGAVIKNVIDLGSTATTTGLRLIPIDIYSFLNTSS